MFYDKSHGYERYRAINHPVDNDSATWPDLGATARKKCLELISLLQQEEEAEPTNEQILNDFRADIRALKQGTLKTRPLQELPDEV